MKHLYLLALLFTSIQLQAQNLVPNPNLENFTICPQQISDFPVTDWYVPTAGTADYHHECGGTNVGVPTNFAGFQNSSTGSAYAGLIIYSTSQFYREYIQAVLTSPTVLEGCYELTIVYSHGDNAGHSNGLGLYLSAGIPPTYTEVPAQLVKVNPEENNDEWHTLTVPYISPGGETHITIGNFYDDNNTTFLPAGSQNTQAYYYIDSVAVQFLGTQSAQIVVDIGPDIEVCDNDFPITITSSMPGEYNLWNTGETGPSIEVNEPGIYSVQTFISCEYGTDEMEITIVPTPSINVEDQLICEGDDFTAIADATLGTYEWDDGSTGNEYTVTEEGMYSVTLTYQCGDIIDAFEVQVLQPIDIPEPIDLQLCVADLPYIVEYTEFDDGINQFLWYEGDDTPGIIITGEGFYGVTISNDCFFDEVDFTVEIHPEIPDFFDFTDTIACPGETKAIYIGYTQVNYEWQDSSTQPFFEAPGPGNYSVTLSNFCGEQIFNFEIDEAVETSLELGQDFSICPGDSVLINSPNGEVITWSNGQTSDHIWISEEGLVIGMLEGLCGMISDTIEVFFNGMAPVVSVPDSLLVCSGDTLSISASNDPNGIEFSWNTGQDTPTIDIHEAGLYIVTGINNCASVQDSVFVTIGQSLPDPNLQDEYLICEGDSVSLSIVAGGGIIQWSTGSIDSFVTIKNNGVHSVSIANSCKTKVDSFTISFIPELAPLTLGPDIGICQGSSVTITGDDFNGDYIWNTDENANMIEVSIPGQYWLEISGQCNTISDTIEILDLGVPPIIDLGQDVSFCLGDSVTIDIGDAIVSEILWNTTSVDPVIIVQSSGTYIVVGTNICGASSDTIRATINDDIPQIELGEDESICPGDSVLLDLGNIAGEISWNNGGAGTTTYAYTEGFYIATLTSSCGESIDSVYVSELEDSPQVNLGLDTTLCEGAELNLAVFASSSTTIEWNDGDDIFFNSFSETGIIWVELSNLCGVTRDSLYLTVIPAIEPISLPADVTICDDKFYILESDIVQDDVFIFWNTFENTASIEISESGTYWVQTGNLCFDESDTFNIEFHESPVPFDIGDNDTICFDESLFLDGFQGDNFTYIWQDNSDQPTYSATQSGSYSLEISNICGSVMDEIELLVLGKLEVQDLLQDEYILCDNETLSIDLSQVPFGNILWNDGSIELQRILTDPGEYFIDLFSICNDTLLSFVFEHENCIQPGIYYPNLFSPNNDGVNDFFSIDLADSYHLPTVKVSIFNRWGEEVFYSEDPDFEWDGTFKNLSTNPGVFAYFYELEAVVDGEIIIIQKAGDITIVK